MHLSELFLDKLEKKKSVLEALTDCDRELKKRLFGQLESEDIIGYYFQPEKPESDLHIRELMDFWDVYRKYADQVSRKEKEERSIFILECVYEVDGICHCDRCARLMESWNSQEQVRIEKLCDAIEGIIHSKYICFFERKKEEWEERYRLDLREFMKSLNNFGYYAVRQKLMEYMERGGLVIVVVGSKGLTPRRLVGFLLRNRDFQSLEPEETDGFREKVLADPKEEVTQYYPKGDSNLISSEMLL